MTKKNGKERVQPVLRRLSLSRNSAVKKRPFLVGTMGSASNGKDEKPVARVVVVESKGRHLGGNPDTEYKRKIAQRFSDIGKKVSWQKLGEGFDKHQFRFQILDEGLYDSWRDELKKLIQA